MTLTEDISDVRVCVHLRKCVCMHEGMIGFKPKLTLRRKLVQVTLFIIYFLFSSFLFFHFLFFSTILFPKKFGHCVKYK